jgi:hypothetical protein
MNMPERSGKSLRYNPRRSSLGVKVDDAFDYGFDLGDDWWHHITVADIQTDVPHRT